jgi:hypothetical protein
MKGGDCGCGMKFSGGARKRKTHRSKKGKKHTRRVRKH